MKNFTIYEDMWIHGTKYKEAENSALLTDTGKLCCLGFCAYSLGVPLTTLKYEAEPRDITDISDYQALCDHLMIMSDDVLLPKHKQETTKLMEVNDADGFPMPARKEQIKSLFNDLGLNPIWKPTAPKEFRESVTKVIKGLV